MVRNNNRIRGITIEIDGDTTKLQTALKDVGTQLNQTDRSLRDVNKLLKLDPGNTELLAQRHRMLGDAVSETREKLETLKTAAQQANDALARGEMNQQQYDALQREIVETTQELKKLEKQARESGEAVQSIAAKGEKLKKAGDTITGVGEKLLPVTGAIVATGGVAASKFAEVDKIMALTNQTMNNTEAEAQELQRAMEEAAANSVFGMNDAATASLNFARAGLKAKEAADALAPAMNLAAGEGGNLDTVSAGLVGTINGFGDSFERTGYYADVFATACNKSALDVDSLSGAMSVAAPIFSAAGYTVNDAALYMGVMANNGIEADKAANSLKTGLARLVSPAKEGAEMMDQLGISVTNSDGTMKDSITIQKELHEAFGKLSESEQIAAASAIFGKNQMAPWLALINTAPEDVGELDAALSSCAGTTDEMAEAMMSGFGGSIEKLKSSLDVLMTSLGQVIAEYLTPLIALIQRFVDWLNALDEGQKKIIITIALVVAAIGPLLIIIGTLLSSIGQIMIWAPAIAGGLTMVGGIITGTVIPAVMSIVTTITGALTGALTGLFALIVANPIGALITLIAGLVLAFIHFWNTSEDFRNAVRQILADIGAWVGGVIDTVSGAFQNVVEFFSGLVDAAYNWGRDFIGGLIDGITSKVSGVIDTVSGIGSTIRSYLHFSVPDVGPLTDYESWMPDFIGTLARNIEDSRWMIQEAMGHVSADMTLAPVSAGSGQVGSASAGQGADQSAAVVALLSQYLPQLARMQVVTDTGALVGELAPQMDRQLGVLSDRQRRL